MVSMTDEQEIPIGENETHEHPNTSPRAIRNVCICGVALVAVFALLHWLSPPFQYGSQLTRPYLAVAGLLVAASFIAFFALINALKVSSQQRRMLLLLIVSFALCTRLITVFTCPILELDYYRYIWDGKTVAAGVSPYLHSPEQVLNAGSNETETLKQLDALSRRTESNHTLLSRVHFEDHTTIYPPVSQAVFASVMKWFPDTASVEAHIVTMKLALVLFDLGTLVLIWLLLGKLGLNVGWMIVYAWNPLVIKEIANGGHLDSIATFFMVASIVLLARWQFAGSTKTRPLFLTGSGIALGLGFGAKLFPVVLLPALAIYVSRKSWVQAGLFSLLFAGIAGLCLWPMLDPIVNREEPPVEVQAPIDVEDLVDIDTALPWDSSGEELTATKAEHGAVGFFSRWRMNDTVFSFVYLNFKDSDRGFDETPWFVVTSSDFRKQFEVWCQKQSIGGDKPAFLMAKVLTLGAFLIFYCWQLLVIRQRKFEPSESVRHEILFLLRRMVIILTAFLFLQPTVNPWYLVWIMPLACFSGNRGWLLASGLLLTYYSRFWFELFDGPFEILWRKYSGVGIYDQFVAWIVTILALGILAFFAALKSQNVSQS